MSYEEKQDEIYKDNETHLAGFAQWLGDKGLAQKTVRSHVLNVRFYINDYLCYYDLLDVSQGCYHVHGFFGNWFIRKAAWSSCAHIKSNAASLKKFYAFLLEKNVVTQEDYDDLCDTIKEFMPDWLDKMNQYERMLFQDYF